MEQPRKLSNAIVMVASATALLLMIPLIAMQFTDEVKWTAFDFTIAGVLIFVTGLGFMVATRLGSSIIYRIANGLVIATTLLLIWANLAVGLIGSGPNLANLLYIAVVAIVIVGTFYTRFKPTGMEITMYLTAMALGVIAAVALIANMHKLPGSSVEEILGVNGFFAVLYTVAGLLFRHLRMGGQILTK